ncbi:hypothetical protein T439DRAFT_332763 [Meredithblackwellia eburnea MCA 4105]
MPTNNTTKESKDEPADTAHTYEGIRFAAVRTTHPLQFNPVQIPDSALQSLRFINQYSDQPTPAVVLRTPRPPTNRDDCLIQREKQFQDFLHLPLSESARQRWPAFWHQHEKDPLTSTGNSRLRYVPCDRDVRLACSVKFTLASWMDEASKAISYTAQELKTKLHFNSGATLNKFANSWVESRIFVDAGKNPITVAFVVEIIYWSAPGCYWVFPSDGVWHKICGRCGTCKCPFCFTGKPQLCKSRCDTCQQTGVNPVDGKQCKACFCNRNHKKDQPGAYNLCQNGCTLWIQSVDASVLADPDNDKAFVIPLSASTMFQFCFLVLSGINHMNISYLSNSSYLDLSIPSRSAKSLPTLTPAIGLAWNDVWTESTAL